MSECCDIPFWKSAVRKVVENLISVKVWVIFGVMVASTYLASESQLSGGDWAALNGGVISAITALREGFKVVSVKRNNKDLLV